MPGQNDDETGVRVNLCRVGEVIMRGYWRLAEGRNRKKTQLEEMKVLLKQAKEESLEREKTTRNRV